MIDELGRGPNCNECLELMGSPMCDTCQHNADNMEYIKVPIHTDTLTGQLIYKLVPVETKTKELIDKIVEKFDGALIRLEDKGEKMDLGKLKVLVEKEVALKVAKKECFTAHDITKAIRSYAYSNVEHSDVRRFVKELVDSKDPITSDLDQYHNFTAFNGDGVCIYYHVDGEDDPIEYLNKIDPSSKPTNNEKDLVDAANDVVQANDELQRAIKTLSDLISIGGEFHK